MKIAELPVWARKTASPALVIIVGVMTVFAAAGTATEESVKRVEVVGFTVVGIALRTTNAKEATGEGLIGKQWGRFMQEGVLNKIPNRIDPDIVVVNTDYASDKDGEYTYVIGARVKPDTQIPAGMVEKKVPAGKYVLFTSEKGPVAQVMIDVWKKIWSFPKSELERAYGADFEVYDQRAADPRNTQVDVYIGVR
jgi:predicted transcriptional regulator YdeE